eukprot:jgi/Undpi1/4300/HiC_scaffold_17.g07666.m1
MVTTPVSPLATENPQVDVDRLADELSQPASAHARTRAYHKATTAAGPAGHALFNQRSTNTPPPRQPAMQAGVRNPPQTKRRWTRSGVQTRRVRSIRSSLGSNSPLCDSDETVDGGDQRAVRLKQGYTLDNSKWPYLPQGEDIMSEFVQLSDILDSPEGQQFVGKFSREIGTEHFLVSWSDMQEFRSIPPTSYRNAEALKVYGKYVRRGLMQLDFIPDDLEKFIHDCMEMAMENRYIIGVDLFLEVQKMCYRMLIDRTFTPLKKKHPARFKACVTESAKWNRRIRVEDFDYIQFLGGRAGVKIAHVVKKSTGRHYAMRIQHKSDLLERNKTDPWRVVNEKVVYEKCHHPFVRHMDYALQTEQYAIIVLNLITTGSIQDAIDESPDKRLDETRAKFYAAELVVGLIYVHEIGLIYRDLNTRNVMVGVDGHIQLADMSGVADSIEIVSALKRKKHGAPVTPEPSIEFFRTMIEMRIEGRRGREISDNELKKTKSEMHNESVDWWSLGITTYKMLTGELPYDIAGRSWHDSLFAFCCPEPTWKKLHAEVKYPWFMSPSAAAFLSALLEPNPIKRLGAGPTGIEDIKSHPFMEGIDWGLLEAKHVEPPYVPPTKPFSERPCYPSFEAMMETLQEDDKRPAQDSARNDADQQKKDWFDSWWYVSPKTRRIETGIGKAMDAMEAKYKNKPSPVAPTANTWLAIYSTLRVLPLTLPRISRSQKDVVSPLPATSQITPPSRGPAFGPAAKAKAGGGRGVIEKETEKLPARDTAARVYAVRVVGDMRRPGGRREKETY